MLILPYQTRFALRSAPLVTLALILINALVFFVAQARDDGIYQSAYRYYDESALPRIELQHYRTWLGRQAARDPDAREQLAELQDALREQDGERALALMQGDEEFIRALHGLQVVTPGDPEFLTWRDARNRYEALLASSTTERFLLKRDALQPWRFVTYQFLHGDLGHWLGNMVVLLLAGSFAEAALGRWRFLAGYLLAGAGAGALHVALSDAPVIGASGAIAGAMAMVAVLYGLRRVPVFVSVLFYFDTFTLPALWLLPIWIANEIWQWASADEESIAYAAHLGGFALGAAYAWLVRPAHPPEPAVEPETESGTERARLRMQQRAEEAAAQVDIPRATKLYADLAAQYPQRADYAVASYNVALLGNDSDALRSAAEHVLVNRPGRASAELRRAFLHIAQSKTRTLLQVESQLRLARRLVRAREDTAALQVIDALLVDDAVRAEHARALSDCLLALFTIYTRHGLAQPADDVRRRLAQYLSPAPAAPPAPSGMTTVQGPSTLNFDLP